MNLNHFKYAVEIAKLGSINKAAESLYVGQSALSRAIKEMEKSLGVVLFDRSSTGMVLTPDGETFVGYAKAVLKQVDDIENLFNVEGLHKQQFSISVPRASYISEAFTRFSLLLGKDDVAEIIYRETNSMQAIQNVLVDNYHLGIIRYAENYTTYYDALLNEKELVHTPIAKYRFALVMHKSSPLAALDRITYKDLENYIQISHPDPYVPSLPLAVVKKDELPEGVTRRIFVFERESQLELLSGNNETFMWVSPIPRSLLKRYNLVQRDCLENKRVYNDVLIYKKDYVLSDMDQWFVDELVKTKRDMIKDRENLK